jgi:iron complex outermembrane receptor protein
MKSLTIFLFSIFIHSLFYNHCFSKEKYDSLKVYSLGEVTILPTNLNKSVPLHTYKITLPTLQSTEVFSTNALRFLLPSGSVRTNSRGETNFFLRGAGERQQAVFFDGMLLNQAFDNRADVSQIPMDVIGGIEVNPMSSSSLYGANTMGGIISITTPELSKNGTEYILRGQLNQLFSNNVSISRFDKMDLFSSIVSVSYLNVKGIVFDGFGDSTLRSNANESFRDNTDQKRVNLLGRFEFTGHKTARVGLTLMNTTEERGVQNEAHLPVSVSRFWRYNDRRRTFAILNAHSGDIIAKRFSLKSSLWFDNSKQTINQYENEQYSSLTLSQFDQNTTIGARLLGLYTSDFGDFTLSMNTLAVEQRETILPVEVLFKEVTSSFGLQYERSFFSVLDLSIGANYNSNVTSDAGNFVSMNNTSRSLPSYFAKIAYRLNADISLNATISKTQRFPALREAFSGSLNRFVPNPELIPETGFFQEIGFQYLLNDNANVKVSLFNNLYDNLITQVRLSAQEDSLRRRKRVNTSNARIRGIETSLQYQLKQFTIIGNYSYMQSFAENLGKKDTLDNRPNTMAGLLIRSNDYFPIVNAQLEVDFVGSSLQRNDANNSQFSEIAPTTLVNFRIGIPLNIESLQMEFSLRCNNIFNELRFSQLGIVEEQRNVLGNLMIRF